jgi:hypothetical protein
MQRHADIWCAERRNVSLRAVSHCVTVAQNQFVSLCAQRDVVSLYRRARARVCARACVRAT